MSDRTFQKNVPDPLLVRERIAEFQIRIGEIEGESFGNSFGKEATVEQLAISKGIAGESMQLEPGVMRELHWHKISVCLNQHLMTFQRRRFTSRVGAFRPSKFRKICSGLALCHPRRTNFECLQVRATRTFKNLRPAQAYRRYRKNCQLTLTHEKVDRVRAEFFGRARPEYHSADY